MAVAAGLVLMAGAAGGAAAQVLLSPPAADVSQTAAAPPVGGLALGGSPTAADVETLERRLAVIRAELRAEMEEQVRRASSGVSGPRETQARDMPEEFIQLVTLLNNQVVGMQQGLHGMQGKVESVMAMTQPQAVPVSLQGQ
jgi:hypothetical protein